MTVSKKTPLQDPTPGLERVQNLIAVSSCKGGVGKSTVAVNLALALSGTGLRVGLFDADIYGPSLPTMIQLENPMLFQKDGLIVPLEYEGIRLMSFGYASNDKDSGNAAIMRGPMVTQVVSQLLGGTQWGGLDYLVIDFPPGTGDVQLTLAQIAKITAALIVTTPQQLSFVDVVKGIKMFDKLNIPTIGVVENMSYYLCSNCGSKHELFGKGAKDRLVNEFGINHSYCVPIDPDLSSSGDSGKPFLLSCPESATAQIYRDMAHSLKQEVDKINQGFNKHPELSYNVGQCMILTMPDGKEYEFSPIDLRLICRCAQCVDEMTGARKITREQLKPDLYPEKITPLGNYAAAVEWSDGCQSCIFPYENILQDLT